VAEAAVLADLLLEAAGSGRGVSFVPAAGSERRVDYALLLQRARALLGDLQRRGLRPGDALLLFVRNNRVLVDAFWACQLGGFIPVPLPAGVQSAALDRLAAVAGCFDTAWRFSERPLYQRLQALPAGACLPAERVCLVEELGEASPPGVPHASAADDTALIQFSSGSTSVPRGVPLSHANVLANLRAISAAALIDAADLTLSWMPLSHDMGLIGFHLVPLYNRLDQVLMDTGLFVRRPGRWLESAAAHGATLLCAPNFGLQHYLDGVATPAAGLDLGRVRLVFVGAEPVSASVCRVFLQRLAPRGLRAGCLFPVYGLAEATLAVTFPEPGAGLRTLRIAADRLAVGDPVREVAAADSGRELVCLGRPLDSCELRIVDARGQAVPDLTLGHLQLRGASVTRGYYGRPPNGSEDRVDGWLDSGDLGFTGAQGLVITGRSKEVFFVAGQNGYPQDVERVLEQAGVAPPGRVVVSAVRSADDAEDRLLVGVQHRGGLDAFLPTVAAVQATLADRAGLRAHAVLPLQRLPRTTSGKLQRYRLALAWEAGDYAALLEALAAAGQAGPAAAATGATEQQLLAVCRDRFPEREVALDQNLFELGADSLRLVGLHEDIETRFPGKVEITDLFEHPTVRALAAWIER
jgi:acyl-CoA synthetase (AMP-forming)/AMP-acid ligase II/aryl carrier-like protein